MAEMQHVYVTAHGNYTPSVWAGEHFQIGLRLGMWDSGNEPARGAMVTMPLNGNVVKDTGSYSGANGTLARAWAARIGPTGSGENADAAWQTDICEDFRAFLVSLATKQSAVVRWTHFKIAPILADGKYGEHGATYQLTTPIVGSGTVDASRRPLPPEVALALTLRANILGRRGRGRMFLPGFYSDPNSVDADGCVYSGLATTILGYAQTLIAALENAPGSEAYGPLVVITSAGKPDAVRPVEVRVGNHWDVQRRRQTQATETYTSATIS